MTNNYVYQYNTPCRCETMFVVLCVGDASSVSRQLPFGSSLQPNQTAASSPVSFKSGSNSPQAQRQVAPRPPSCACHTPCLLPAPALCQNFIIPPFCAYCTPPPKPTLHPTVIAEKNLLSLCWCYSGACKTCRSFLRASF